MTKRATAEQLKEYLVENGPEGILDQVKSAEELTGKILQAIMDHEEVVTIGVLAVVMANVIDMVDSADSGNKIGMLRKMVYELVKTGIEETEKEVAEKIFQSKA